MAQRSADTNIYSKFAFDSWKKNLACYIFLGGGGFSGGSSEQSCILLSLMKSMGLEGSESGVWTAIVTHLGTQDPFDETFAKACLETRSIFFSPTAS